MYTRGGDRGETGLFGAKRVSKDSPRVEAYGTVDELNSCIGVAVSLCGFDDISKTLREVQRLLLVAGADLATELAPAGAKDRVPRIRSEDVVWLEKEVDAMQSKLTKLTKFIIPGGSQLSAQIHLARAVCRRAERRIVTAGKSETINPEILPFFNRLSTHLFDLARLANASEGRKDEVWE